MWVATSDVFKKPPPACGFVMIGCRRPHERIHVLTFASLAENSSSIFNPSNFNQESYLFYLLLEVLNIVKNSNFEYGPPPVTCAKQNTAISNNWRETWKRSQHFHNTKRQISCTMCTHVSLAVEEQAKKINSTLALHNEVTHQLIRGHRRYENIQSVVIKASGIHKYLIYMYIDSRLLIFMSESLVW